MGSIYESLTRAGHLAPVAQAVNDFVAKKRYEEGLKAMTSLYSALTPKKQNMVQPLTNPPMVSGVKNNVVPDGPANSLSQVPKVMNNTVLPQNRGLNQLLEQPNSFNFEQPQVEQPQASISDPNTPSTAEGVAYRTLTGNYNPINASDIPQSAPMTMGGLRELINPQPQAEAQVVAPQNSGITPQEAQQMFIEKGIANGWINDPKLSQNFNAYGGLLQKLVEQNTPVAPQYFDLNEGQERYVIENGQLKKVAENVKPEASMYNEFRHKLNNGNVGLVDSRAGKIVDTGVRWIDPPKGGSSGGGSRGSSGGGAGENDLEFEINGLINDAELARNIYYRQQVNKVAPDKILNPEESTAERYRLQTADKLLNTAGLSSVEDQIWETVKAFQDKGLKNEALWDATTNAFRGTGQLTELQIRALYQYLRNRASSH